MDNPLICQVLSRFVKVLIGCFLLDSGLDILVSPFRLNQPASPYFASSRKELMDSLKEKSALWAQ